MPSPLNLLEPVELVEHFLEHPPTGFAAFRLDGNVPAFATDFNLLTTLDPDDRKRIERLPGYTRWRHWLCPHTAFVGATVTEHALFPEQIAPADFVATVRRLASPEFPFVIVKDIPTDPDLVGAAASNYASALIDAARAMGFLIVDGQALAHVPIDFADLDDYLARLSHARRRDIRRKLRARNRLEISEIPTGHPCFADEAVLSEYYSLYRNVYEQSEIHFDCLTPAFFRSVLQDAASGGVVVTYRAAGRLIGFNLCFVYNDALIDKYVGFAYPAAREFNLYAVSWCHNLELAKHRGLKRYIAGWTDPEIKRALGAKFSLTRHAVFVRNPMLRALLSPFKRWFESDRQWLERANAAGY